jgi:hypothetical protein
MLALGVSTLKHRQTFWRYTLDRMALSWMTLGTLLDQLMPFRHLYLISKLHYPVAWSHLKVAYPQSLQSKADLEAYQTIQFSRDLATALWKIHGKQNAHPFELPKKMIHQSILGPTKSRRSAFQFILPIELRLRFLVGYFPI